VQKNSGVVFSGGTQTVGQVVAGPNARAEMAIGANHADDASRQQDLSRQLDALIQLLQEQQTTIPEATYLLGDARRVATEIQKPEPDGKKVGNLLGILEEGTKGLASAASIVSSVKFLASSLLGIA
jgi:hypothetical protein